MAGMNNQWRSGETIPDLPARASAFHVWLHRLGISFGTLAMLAAIRCAS
jgi:hypothetical protein